MTQQTHFTYTLHQPKTQVLLLWALSFLIKLITIFFFTGILHPDAIYQSLEIAHYWVYGYGIIPPEFQSIRNNPYTMSRSPIFPAIFYPFFYIGNALNLPYYAFILPSISVFLAFNASLLTPASYYFLNELFQHKKHGLTLFMTSLTVFHWTTNHYSLHALTNSFFLPTLLFLFTLYLKHLNNYQGVPSILHHYLVPLLVAIITYIRFDLLIPFVFLLLGIGGILLYEQRIQHWWFLVYNVLGGISGFAIAGYIDYVYYGVFFVSPLHWFTFNIILGGSANFGVMPFYFYFLYFFVFNPFSLIALILGGKQLIQQRSLFSSKTPERIAYQAKLLTFFVWLMTFLAFSAIGHKELRFMYQGQVFYLYFMAQVYWDTITQIATRLNPPLIIRLPARLSFQSTKHAFRVFLVSMLFLLLLESLVFASVSGVITKRREMIAGYIYISEQNDARGVIHVGNIYTAPGYTYLHTNVPITGFHDLSQESYQEQLNQTLYIHNIYNYVFVSLTYLQWVLQNTPLTTQDIVQWIMQAGYELVYTYKNAGYVYKLPSA